MPTVLNICHPSLKGACVADFSFAGARNQELELQKFIQSPECFVMLLSKQGAVGLDLSFVTHIFFLGKPICESAFHKGICQSLLISPRCLSNRLNI